MTTTNRMSPLRFHPIYQERVWGGRQFETSLGRQLPDSRPYGESWELSDREEAQSRVVEGPLSGLSLHDLWETHRAEVFGTRYASHSSLRFPLLIKTLDCGDKLSLQVHPPEAKAAQLGGEPKTEMWYVARASDGATIYAGVKGGVTREQFASALNTGSVEALVHQVHPENGQYMQVPSGRLHALGAGLLVYEIQQNSDTTYRVFDWNRNGLDGKPRTLHVEQSLECIDFADVEPALGASRVEGLLASCPWYEVRTARMPGKGQARLDRREDFVCVLVTEGQVKIGDQIAEEGTLMLVPPSPAERVVSSERLAAWLEVRLP